MKVEYCIIFIVAVISGKSDDEVNETLQQFDQNDAKLVKGNKTLKKLVNEVRLRQNLRRCTPIAQFFVVKCLVQVQLQFKTSVTLGIEYLTEL